MRGLAGGKAYYVVCLFLLAWGLGCQGSGASVGAADDRGYFAAQDLPETLAAAAGSMQSNTDIRPMLSAVLFEDNRARVDFSPPVYPQGLSFSLENLNPHRESDTIMFTLRVPRSGPVPQNELVMFCLMVIVNATSPALSAQELAEIDQILLQGGVATVAGWEYNAFYDEQADPMVFTFSAQKLPATTQP